MARREHDVDGFLRDLVHARKDEIQELRAAILAANPGITERIKWNAPSFCYGGDDRVTFRLQPDDRVELVFHRGAKVRPDAESFEFDDPTGLLAWASADRGVVTVADSRELKARKAEIVALVDRWMRSTVA